MLGEWRSEDGRIVVDIQFEGFKISHHQLHTGQPYNSVDKISQ
jgi:hypothetical protein